MRWWWARRRWLARRRASWERDQLAYEVEWWLKDRF